MHYEFDFQVIWDGWHLLLDGLWITLAVTICSLSASLVLGLTFGLLRLSKSRILSWAALAYIETFRNTPALVQLVWVYYCLPILTGVNLSAAVASTLTLALYGGAYNAEIFRAGIQSIDRGQIEAGLALGLKPFDLFRRITFPQAVRRVIPPLVNESITLLKFSSLVSILGVADLTYKAQVLATTTFRPIETFTFIGIVYFALCGVLSILATRLESKMARFG
jgi:polar amino acid transport system permease protein